MKKLTLLLLCLMVASLKAQQAYYNDVDVTLTGQQLYNELQQKIDNASGNYTYGDVRDSFFVMDEDPANNDNVLLIYGYNDGDGNCITDRSRNKQSFGGSNCEYNREHTFARSNSNPSMGSVNNSSTGIGADPHNLRPSDVQFNNNRGNKKYMDGSGNAGDVGSGNWYPGDEWKGDVARIMMYMYTRYGDQCLPSLNGVGALEGNTQMLQTYLQWNVDDPVTILEDQRNTHLQQVYGNRNPFIDQPLLATAIWGGPEAEDRWMGTMGINEQAAIAITMYPNPASEFVYFTTTSGFEPQEYVIYDVTGRMITSEILKNETIDISQLTSGLYLLSLTGDQFNVTKQLIVE